MPLVRDADGVLHERLVCQPAGLRVGPADAPAVLPRCSRRRDAEADGAFVYLPPFGWVFTGGDAPRRRMTWRGRRAAQRGEQPFTDHEPVVWSCCPFCGGDLPDALAAPRDVRSLPPGDPLE